MPRYTISAYATWSEIVENPSGGESTKTEKDSYLNHRFRARNDNAARKVGKEELEKWKNTLPKEKTSGITLRSTPVVTDIDLSRRIRR